MAISDAFPGPVTLTIAGERMVFPLLKMSQLGAFQRQLAETRNARLRRTADERKLNGEQSARFIEFGEMEEIEISHMIRHGASIDGSQEYVLASLKNAGKSEADAKAIIDTMRPAQVQYVAMRAVGYEPSKDEEERMEGEQPKNPT